MTPLHEIFQTILHPAGLLPSAALTVILSLIMQHARTSMWRLALLALPGTIAHEMAHFVIGFLLLAKPARFSVWPKQVGDRWVLGSVSFSGINIFNGAFVALAPILFLPIAWFCLIHLGAPFWVNHQWGRWLITGYFTSTILFAAIPSAQDIKQGAPSLFLYGLFGGLWWFLK
jgi:hypothetical protein